MSSLLALPFKLIGSLLKPPAQPQAPVAPPQNPAAPDNSAAAAERDNAARTALAEQASAGRRSTIVAGASILDDQKDGDFSPVKRRMASRTLMG